MWYIKKNHMIYQHADKYLRSWLKMLKLLGKWFTKDITIWNKHVYIIVEGYPLLRKDSAEKTSFYHKLRRKITRSVGCCHDENLFPCLQTIHFRQQLINNTCASRRLKDILIKYTVPLNDGITSLSFQISAKKPFFK